MHLQVIEFCKEDTDTRVSLQYNSRVYTINRSIREVSSSHKSCLVTTVVLGVVNKVYSYLLVSIWTRAPLSKAFESGVFSVLRHFKLLGILVLGVAVLLIQGQAFFVIARHLVSKLEQWRRLVGT
jgi:protein-S-isoprenylcysteine O-methyltransferase Ste14